MGLTTLILLAAGFVLGSRFTVFVLVPFGVVITISCIAWGVSERSPEAFFAWATYIASINVGFLLASMLRNRKRTAMDHHYQSRS